MMDKRKAYEEKFDAEVEGWKAQIALLKASPGDNLLNQFQH